MSSFGDSRRGQAALEYILCVAALLVVIGIMGYLVRAAQRSADRTEELVRADYP